MKKIHKLVKLCYNSFIVSAYPNGDKAWFYDDADEEYEVYVQYL